jgi:hypothetical protein
LGANESTDLPAAMELTEPMPNLEEVSEMVLSETEVVLEPLFSNFVIRPLMSLRLSRMVMTT